MAGRRNWRRWPSRLTSHSTARDTWPASIAVSVSPADLTPGSYFGRIQIGSPGAPNSPRLVTVVLRVTPAGQTSNPDVSPAGLLFTGASPLPQTLSISASGA